jgi:hypothetical protein
MSAQQRRREMKQQSAIDQFSAKASSRAAMRVRKLWPLVAVLIMPMSNMATSDARYNDLGHRMICTCERQAPTGMGAKGCRQVLLECDHLDCPTSARMRRELKAALQKGDTDDVILHSFVQKYSASVVNVPREVNGLALIVFLVTLTASASITIVFLRVRRSRAAMLTTTAAERRIEVDAPSSVREKREQGDA